MSKVDGPRTAITPTRADDYAEWYQQVIRAADLAENAPVRGCMVIKPLGYAVWENIQRELDDRFKATGHKNAYFPLFIPKSFLEKEAKHVEGFAKECAVVTHYRLKLRPDGVLDVDPDAALEEPLVVRPTSETIIGAMFAKWIRSYRDLPLLLNQWANVVRWEMRPRMFLRTTEFLWQEGHTAHATEEEAVEETRRMLEVYADFAENCMAMPVIRGKKSESERFPGAVDTYAIEAMMQDRKALQAGTSHFLGQNFARASEIQFQTAAGGQEHAWTTSWGVSTRLIGGIIMTHADDDGLVVPPRLAAVQVVLLPVLRGEEQRPSVMGFVESLAAELRALIWHGRPLRVEVDARDLRGGDKMWDWVKKGAALRVEVGGREVEAGTVSVGSRTQAARDRQTIPRAQLVGQVGEMLDAIQNTLLERARAHRAEHTRAIDSKGEFFDFFTPRNTEKPEIHGGFAVSPWCGDAGCEETARAQKVTIRCLPTEDVAFQGEARSTSCVLCGRPMHARAIFAKAY